MIQKITGVFLCSRINTKKSKEHCDVVRKKNFHLERYFYTIAHLVMNASLHYMDYKTR